MRLRELQQAEQRYLIFNGWFRRRVRDAEFWYHPEHNPPDVGRLLNQDDAITWQKVKDRGPGPRYTPEEVAALEEPLTRP